MYCYQGAANPREEIVQVKPANVDPLYMTTFGYIDIPLIEECATQYIESKRQILNYRV